MISLPVPESVRKSRPGYLLVSMGRPPGVAEEDCGTAEMLIGQSPPIPGFPGRDQFAYFKPTETELRWLNEGGFIEFNQVGQVVQPFSATVWPPEQVIDDD